MTDLTESLLKEGWYLSDEGIAELKGSAEKITHSDIIRIALDADLRPVGRKVLPSDINSGRTEKLEGPCVLQLQKVRNISAPKDHEESQSALRMRRLQMTDGHTTCVGLEYKDLSKIRPPKLDSDTEIIPHHSRKKGTTSIQLCFHDFLKSATIQRT